MQLLGDQPQQVVYEHLGTNDIFCIPSLKEALGVANIEALASGISVISTNTGGIPEVLDNGNNGWLVNLNDPQALADAIKECIGNAQKRMDKSINGRKFISKFSVDTMLDNFIRILEDALSAKFTTSAGKFYSEHGAATKEKS